MKPVLALLPALVALQVGVSPALAWTWPVDGPVLQPFSFDAENPYAAGRHRGVDVGAPAGTPVIAPAAGTVSFAGTVPGGGLTLAVRTPDGYSVTLVHLGAIAVARGAAVAEGGVIGSIGPSGAPELPEPYVHLGVRIAADTQGYVDPLSLLPPTAAAPADVGASSEQEPLTEVGVGAPGAEPQVSVPPAAGAGDTTSGSDPARSRSTRRKYEASAPPRVKHVAESFDHGGTYISEGAVPRPAPREASAPLAARLVSLERSVAPAALIDESHLAAGRPRGGRVWLVPPFVLAAATAGAVAFGAGRRIRDARSDEPMEEALDRDDGAAELVGVARPVPGGTSPRRLRKQRSRRCSGCRRRPATPLSRGRKNEKASV